MRASTADVRRKYRRKWGRARIPSESGRGAIEHRGGPPESGGADMEVCYSYMRKARSLRVGSLCEKNRNLVRPNTLVPASHALLYFTLLY